MLSDNFFAKVENIEIETVKETVYNLEVEDDHSYVVNNIAVHNCYIGSTPDNIEGIDVYKEMSLLSSLVVELAGIGPKLGRPLGK